MNNWAQDGRGGRRRLSDEKDWFHVAVVNMTCLSLSNREPRAGKAGNTKKYTKDYECSASKISQEKQRNLSDSSSVQKLT